MDIVPKPGRGDYIAERKGVRLLFIMILGIMIGIVMFSQWQKRFKSSTISQDTEKTTAKSQKDSSTAILPGHLVNSSRRTRITDIFNEVYPAIVSIHTQRVYAQRRQSSLWDAFWDPYFYFPRDQYYRVDGIGSGCIVNAEGYILTNEHVIHDAAAIKVVLPDSREFEAKLVSADFMSDVALLKIEGQNLPHTKLGNSDDILIAEEVIAIGNPFGNLLSDEFGRSPLPSVSRGIISALNRSFTAPREGVEVIYHNMIQTDAAINPGNSGGPLVNLDGEVIGVNTAIFSRKESTSNIGFALPINRVKALMDEIMQYGKVREVDLGLTVENLNRVILRYLGYSLDIKGVLVTNVKKNLSADRAGLKVYDIIVEVNGKTINNYKNIDGQFHGSIKGDKFEIKYIRKRKLYITQMEL